MAYRTTNYFSICSLQMEHQSAAASFSIGTIGTNGTNRQIVHARPSGVNMCSLQMEHRSAVSCSNGTIGTNGTNRQIVHVRPGGVNMCSWLQAASFSNGANRKASLTNGDFFTNGSIGEGFLTIGIRLCILDMCDLNDMQILTSLTITNLWCTHSVLFT